MRLYSVLVLKHMDNDITIRDLVPIDSYIIMSELPTKKFLEQLESEASADYPGEKVLIYIRPLE